MPVPTSLINTGTGYYGFSVKKVTPLPALRGTAIELEHRASGARLLHLHTDDPENLFSVSLPTPPPDDTGIPHILEHSVLAGSRRFPVREPFFEMLKSSMATFINAMTGPDCTYYPVSSNVRRDLFNLAEVYFDAIFHPLLSQTTFQREGHHLSPADPANPAAGLTINGVVYNEMKGVFSNPESRLFYTWIKRLLPDTAYALNYAGHPDSIPDLTYAQFKRFHETYYHPGNAYFFVYGDIPTLDYLEFLEPRLSGFARHPPAPRQPRQPRWTSPMRCHETYPAAPGESPAGKTYLAMTWLIGNALDPELAVLRHVLSHILFGNEAAPLKKALIDSRLGHDLLDCGGLELGPEAVFTIGLKGCEPDRVDAFEELILSSLKSLRTRGVKSEWINAAFQQAAYHYLEIPALFPVHTMSRILGAWVHGADPLTFADMSSHLETCRKRVAADPGLFSRLIQEQLIDNPHRLTTLLRPDPGQQTRTDAAFAARMAHEIHLRTEAELQRIADEAAAIDQTAGTPNSPDQIALLPQLHVRDLPAKPRPIPTTLTRLPTAHVSPPESRIPQSGIPLLRNDVFSNGVNYLQFSFNLDGLPGDLWSFLPYYCDAISKLGAAGMNYETLAERAAASTGGISCSPSFQYHATLQGRPVLNLRFACKALDQQMDKALDILHDLVFAVDPRDRNRLRHVLIQTRSGYRSDLLENGLSYAQTHAGQFLNPVGALNELCHGIPQVALAARLCDHFDQEADVLMDHIERIRSFILSPSRLAISFTGSDAAFDSVEKAFSSWTFPKGSIEECGNPISNPTPHTSNPRSGLAVPIDVAHCVQAMPAPTLRHPHAAALVIGAHMARFDYFLSEIRLKGNAYGAGISYNPLAGTLNMTSFRDPHVIRTLDVFARTPDYVRSSNWSQADIDRAIIGTAKGDERPLRPAEVTGEALARHLQGITPELRESFYQARLAVTPESARVALMETLEAGLVSSPVCVLASRERLEVANRTLGDKALSIQDVAM